MKQIVMLCSQVSQRLRSRLLGLLMKVRCRIAYAISITCF
jgi:hypothetical protein